MCSIYVFFFFQAEDGIRDADVTGVQTCALPIFSENIIKISLPYKKQVYRVLDKDGMFYGADAVCLASEVSIDKIVHPFDSNKSVKLNNLTLEPLLKEVIVNGNRVSKLYNIKEIAEYSKNRLEKLPDEYKRFQNPHIYKVGLSAKLKEERDKLISKHKA